MSRLSSRSIAIPMLLGLLAASLPLTACGSSSSTANTTAADQGKSINYTKALAFASCMRSHGVPTFPDPKSNSSGGMQIQTFNGTTSVNGVQVNAPAFQSAMQACRSSLPNAGHPQQLPESKRKAALEYSACMRTHGVPDFPDPSFNRGGAMLRVTPGSGPDPNSPAFKAAQRACQPLMQKLFGKGAAVGA